MMFLRALFANLLICSILEIGNPVIFKQAVAKLAEQEGTLGFSANDLLPILANSEISAPTTCQEHSPKFARNTTTYGRYNPDYCLISGLGWTLHFVIEFALLHQYYALIIVVEKEDLLELRNDLHQTTKLLSSKSVKVKLTSWEDLLFLPIEGAILFVSLSEVVTEHLIKLDSYMQNQPKASWLLNSNQSREDLKDTKCAFDSNIFTYFFKDGVATVQEFYRVTETTPLVTNLVGVWSPNSGLIMTKLQKWDRRTDLGGIQMTAAVAADPRYIEISCLNGKDGPLKVWGFGYDIWHSFELAMNFSTIFVPSIDGKWGAKTPNGTFDGIIGMLERHEIDAGVSSFYLLQGRLEVSDFIGPLYTLIDGLYYRDSPTLDPNAFVAPLSGHTWLAYGCSILLCTMAFFAVTRFGGDPSDGRHNQDPCFSLMTIMHGVSNKGAPVEPTKLSGRVIFLFVYLTTLVIVAAYSAALTSILAVQIHQPPFTDEATMLHNSPYSIITVKATSYVDIFQFGTQVQRAIFEDRFLLTDTLGEAINMFLSRPNLVLLWTASMLQAKFGNLCDLKVIPNVNFDTWNVFYIQKENPHRQLFNKIISHMDESGELGKYYRKWFPSRNPADCKSSQINSLGIEKVFSSFVFMLFGIIVAVLIFLLETVIQRKRFATTQKTVLSQWAVQVMMISRLLRNSVLYPIPFKRRRNAA